MNKIERIYLIGYMGCGKSAVGRSLADSLCYSYLDMDEEIERLKGLSAREIFIKFGEHEYRNLEAKILDGTKSQRNLVISCSNGIILDEMNCDFLREECTLFLDGDESVFFDRIKDKKEMPNAFLDTKDEEEKQGRFVKLYHARLPLYEKCMTERIMVDNRNPDEISGEIRRKCCI